MSDSNQHQLTTIPQQSLQLSKQQSLQTIPTITPIPPKQTKHKQTTVGIIKQDTEDLDSLYPNVISSRIQSLQTQ